MDPRSAISDVPFPPSVAAYNVPEIWPLSNDSRRPHFGQNPEMNHRDLSAEESTVTEQSESRGGQKRRDTAVATASEDESSKLAAANGGRNDYDVMDSNGKRLKVYGPKCKNGNLKVEMETSSGNGNKPVEQNAQSSEAPKQDYIHVRARRGQATDSHSLSERARREKISERMKILQDLVPGCNKVIGKASVLDEIINYIQSLQRQVEVLSMKLEAVNSRSIPSMEMFPAKDFGVQMIDTTGMAFTSQSIREYVQGSHTERLHMQTGGGFERPM